MWEHTRKAPHPFGIGCVYHRKLAAGSDVLIKDQWSQMIGREGEVLYVDEGESEQNLSGGSKDDSIWMRLRELRWVW